MPETVLPLASEFQSQIIIELGAFNNPAIHYLKHLKIELIRILDKQIKGRNNRLSNLGECIPVFLGCPRVEMNMEPVERRIPFIAVLRRYPRRDRDSLELDPVIH